jgi:hypothetical protein
VNRQLDPTIDRLTRTFRTVADQVVDAPPDFVAVPVAPVPRPRRRRTVLVAAACVLALVAGAVAVALVRESGRGHTPVIDEPSSPTTIPTTAAPSLEHLVPGPAGTITKIDVQDASSLPAQPREYQLGYAGTVDAHAAQLVITADDFSNSQMPNFTLENHGCDTNGDGSPRFPGTIIPIGDHQACLITNIQSAIHLGWIDDDGVSVLIQASGLSVEQVEAIGQSVERTPGTSLEVDLRQPPPAGLDLTGKGLRPPFEDVWVSFDQDGCSYFLTAARADPIPFFFDPYSATTTVRGQAGRIIGIQNVTWVDGDTRFGVSLDASDVRQAPPQCDSAGVAESLVPIDEAAWQQLLADRADLVRHNGT